MQAFENFIDAAKSGGGENLNGRMAELGILQNQTNNLLPGFPVIASQTQPIQTRAALGFLLSDKGNFFREFLLDEVTFSSRTRCSDIYGYRLYFIIVFVPKVSLLIVRGFKVLG